MKIVIASKYGSIPGSGTLTRLFYIAKHLAERGHEVEYIISDSNHLSLNLDKELVAKVEDENSIALKIFNLINYSNQKSPLRLLSWLQFEIKLLCYLLFRKTDLLVVSSPSIFSIFTGVFLKFIKRTKLVVDIRDIWPATLIEEGGVNPRHPLMKLMTFIQNLGYRKADLILSSIPNLGSHIRETIGKDRPFFCLPMGFESEDDDIGESCEQNLIDLSFLNDKFVVGYVGSIGPTNNLDTFFELVKQSSNPRMHFLVVGDGGSYDKFRDKVRDCSNITFIGRVPKQLARKYIQICDVMYFSTHNSSIWKYGQSLNKLLDYMLIGKPVVAAYPDYGYQTMINEADCGYFIESDNLQAHQATFEKLICKGKDELENIGLRGRDWVLRNRQYKTLVAEFNEVIKSV